MVGSRFLSGMGIGWGLWVGLGLGLWVGIGYRMGQACGCG